MLRRIVSFALVAFVAPGLFAQDLEEALSQVGNAYAETYLRPFTDAVGANLNTGLYYDAAVGKTPFGMDIFVGVEAFGAMLQNTDHTFDLTFSSRVDLEHSINGETETFSVPATFEVRDAPTVFGDDDPAVGFVTATHDTTVIRHGMEIPVAFDTTFTRELIGGVIKTNIVPAAIPHIRIGSLLGTDLMLRWLPDITIPEVGSVGLFGIGVRHSIDQYIPLSPVNVAVQVAWQHLGVDNLKDDEMLGANTFAGSISVSRRFGVLALFGGVQTERSTLDVAYELDSGDQDVGTVPITFHAVGKSKARGTLGAGLHLGPVRLHGSYSIGQINVVRAGFGFAY